MPGGRLGGVQPRARVAPDHYQGDDLVDRVHGGRCARAVRRREEDVRAFALSRASPRPLDTRARTVSRGSEWDWNRTAKMATFGAAWHGPSGHFFYGFLDSKLPGTAVQTVISKVAIDQARGRRRLASASASLPSHRTTTRARAGLLEPDLRHRVFHVPQLLGRQDARRPLEEAQRGPADRRHGVVGVRARARDRPLARGPFPFLKRARVLGGGAGTGSPHTRSTSSSSPASSACSTSMSCRSCARRARATRESARPRPDGALHGGRTGTTSSSRSSATRRSRRRRPNCAPLPP